MPKRAKFALLAVLTVALVVSLAGVALAAVPPSGGWTDLSYSLVGKYGITLEQVGMISDGYPDGSWQPYNDVPRKQFIKMAVDAYKIPLKNPATPSFTDVPASDYYYQYIEGAKAAGLTNGTGNGNFSPDATITREQAAAIIVRWVAPKNGYDLDTLFTPEGINEILGDYPDGDAVSESLKKEIAFAVSFGIIWGTADGKLAPADTMTRIQGAAMLIRSWGIIPPTPPVKDPAGIEVVSDDHATNLIGKFHIATVKVTDAAGDPVEGALVGFNTVVAPWYVGNIATRGILTDANGLASAELLSTEPGIQRVDAHVYGKNGIVATYTTKYWVALDEVYIVDVNRTARNNVNTPHEWVAQCYVMGPGPLSTAQSQWYNFYRGDAGIDYCEDGVSYNDILIDMDTWTPRTMAGIDMYWSLSATSVGDIVEVDGAAIDPAKSAVGVTDADGYSWISINSTAAGTTVATVVADYAENPYPGTLFNHMTNTDYEDHNYGWDTQPAPFSSATKTWIPHTIGPADSNISPAYTELNIGEELLLTLTLKDEWGNPVVGKDVEWYMQGVGQFKSDDDRTQSNDGLGFWSDRDLDKTDAAGTCRLLVKSLDPGEMIIHAKYRDKGTGGQEGRFLEDVAEVQWFKVDIATFDHPETVANEAVATNEVNTEHTFDLWVYGAKYEYFPSLWAGTTGFDTQTSWIDTDAAGRAYDGVMDVWDAKYLDPNGILIVNLDALDASAYDPATGKIKQGDDWVTYTDTLTGIKLGSGGITEYDFNGDGVKETAAAMRLALQGAAIYLPLEGKGVDFVDNGTVGDIIDAGVAGSITYAGVDYDYDAITDEAGWAYVTIKSTAKGTQVTEAVVDYPANPAKGTQRIRAWATKTWTTQAAPNDNVKIVIDGLELNPGEAAGPNPVFDASGQLNYANIQIHVLDEFGNELPDYEVVYEIVGNGQWIPGTQGAADTYHPWQTLQDVMQDVGSLSAVLSDRFPATNPITNAAANQKFREFTNATGPKSGNFYAQTVRAGWAWEFSATGLAALPVTPASGTDTYNVYKLWALDELGAATELAEFQVDPETNAVEGGKVFGVADLDGAKRIVVTAVKNSADPYDADGPVVYAGAIETSIVMDGNGELPDNSEPRDDTGNGYQDGVGPNDSSIDAGWADPYATIVGKGGTEAYFFWRGAPKPTEWNYMFMGDGAKAWTLNGIDADKPHGSNIDVVLMENPYAPYLPWMMNGGLHSLENGQQDMLWRAWCNDDVRCIVNIQIFKPANGPVIDGTPWRVFEVQKVWAPTAADGFSVGIEVIGDVVDDTDDILTGRPVTLEATLPDGAQWQLMYFEWMANGEVFHSGWGEDQAEYTSEVSGDVEFTLAVYAAPCAEPMASATATVVLGWYAVDADCFSIDQDASVNTVECDHTCTSTLSDAYDPDNFRVNWWVVRDGALIASQDGLEVGEEFIYSNAAAGEDTIYAELVDPYGNSLIPQIMKVLIKTWEEANGTP
ncbi:MAG: hypothetical protein GX604_05915 [Actinobacteria bacterium]|nr:hypothetical protein [Actinomycetota bacterium]